MKAFVAVIASLAASAKGEAQIFANGVYGYAGYPGYAYNGLTYAAPATVAAAPVATVAAAAHHAVAAPALAYAHHPYAVVNPSCCRHLRRCPSCRLPRLRRRCPRLHLWRIHLWRIPHPRRLGQALNWQSRIPGLMTNYSCGFLFE